MTKQPDPELEFCQDAVITTLMQNNPSYPPADLDQAIIAQAHHAKQKAMSWKIPLSIAATVLFSFTLLWNLNINPNQPFETTAPMAYEPTIPPKPPFDNTQPEQRILTSSDAISSKKTPNSPVLGSAAQSPDKKRVQNQNLKDNIFASRRKEKKPVLKLEQEMKSSLAKTRETSRYRSLDIAKEQAVIIDLKIAKTTTPLLYKSALFTLQAEQHLCFQNQSLGLIQIWSFEHWIQKKSFDLLLKKITPTKAQIWIRFSSQSKVDLNSFNLALNRKCHF